MKLVRYDPKFRPPIFIHGIGERTQTMSVNDARQLHKELGKVLKKIPTEKYGDKRNEIINQAGKLCEKFIAKVETGRARSRETYAECKALLSVINEEKK